MAETENGTSSFFGVMFSTSFGGPNRHTETMMHGHQLSVMVTLSSENPFRSGGLWRIRTGENHSRVGSARERRRSGTLSPKPSMTVAVPSSFLLLVVRHLLLEAMHLFLVASCY